MAKRLVIKTGEYTNSAGEKKGRYVRLGTILRKDDNEFVLIDPTVNLAGSLMLQNIMNRQNGKDIRDNLMVSIFDDDDAPAKSNGSESAPAKDEDFEDDIPFN